MEQVARKTVSWLIKQRAVEEEKRKLYEYAVQSFLWNIAPFLYAIFIGTLMRKTWISIILIIPFMSIRKYSGGFHAKSGRKCVVSSSILLFVAISIASRITYGTFFSIIVLLAVISLIIFSPIDSENRKLDQKESVMRKKDTARISLFFLPGFYWLTSFRKTKSCS